MNETTPVILKKYAGYQLLVRLEGRVRELEEVLKERFLDEFYPPAQPVSKEMLSCILDSGLPLIWARTSSESNIENIVSEIDLAEGHISGRHFGFASIPLSMSLIEEL